mmetsp:Transcript_10721/g.20322  ORF Transcript_10721/g.20322 Transcript_10721/m.20322 type:complete len:246 (-) Transcript_10721:683-1420(-)
MRTSCPELEQSAAAGAGGGGFARPAHPVPGGGEDPDAEDPSVQHDRHRRQQPRHADGEDREPHADHSRRGVLYHGAEADLLPDQEKRTEGSCWSNGDPHSERGGKVHRGAARRVQQDGEPRVSVDARQRRQACAGAGGLPSRTTRVDCRQPPDVCARPLPPDQRNAARDWDSRARPGAPVRLLAGSSKGKGARPQQSPTDTIRRQRGGHEPVRSRAGEPKEHVPPSRQRRSGAAVPRRRARSFQE